MNSESAVDNGQLELSDCQRRALDRIQAGESVFITGMPGSGKSALLSSVVQTLSDGMLLTATTGCAATSIGGVTVHAALSLVPTSESCLAEFVHTLFQSLSACRCVTRVKTIQPLVDTLAAVRMHRCKLARIKSTRLLVIDEVSMLSPFLFGVVDCIFRIVHGTPDLFFGGVQLLLVGDHAQLPPVSTAEERGQNKRVRRELALGDLSVSQAAEWACSIVEEPEVQAIPEWISSAYQRTTGCRYLFQHPDFARLPVHLLQVNFRQRDDPTFQRILERLRYGQPLEGEDLLAIQSRTIRDLPAEVDDATTVLFSRRISVMRFNAFMQALNRVRHPELGATVRLTATFKTDRSQRDTAVRQSVLNHLCPREILVRRGDRIMVIRNLAPGIYNGLAGRLVGVGFSQQTRSRIVNQPTDCYREDDESHLAPVDQIIDRPADRVTLLLQLPDQRLLQLQPSRYESKQTRGSIQHTQFAIVAAHAMTVHKAQGKTLESVVCVVDDAFEPGLVYVALSRARTLANLQIVSQLEQPPTIPSQPVIDYHRQLGM